MPLKAISLNLRTLLGQHLLLANIFWMRFNNRYFFTLLLSLLTIAYAEVSNAQQRTEAFGFPWFQQIRIWSDTSLTTAAEDVVIYAGKEYISFPYARPNQTVELEFYPSSSFTSAYLGIANSRDFEMVDSAMWVNDSFFRFKIRFRNLEEIGPITLILNFDGPNDKQQTYNFNILPFAYTEARLLPREEDLYIGEAKIFELDVNRPMRLKADNVWQSQDKYDYKIAIEERIAKLYLLPKETGRISVNIPIQTRFPFMIGRNRAGHDLPPLRYNFTVKSGRLAFLQTDKKDVTFEKDFGKGIEIQIDNHRYLQLKKTYRIEKQNEAGGPLVGELYTRGLLSNDKVLCWFRPYDLHRLSDGYLYIKDGDETKFITNFTISERLQVEKVSLKVEGGDWSGNLTVNPGAAGEIRIEGKGLTKAYFELEDAVYFRPDSVINTEEIVVYKFRIPSNVPNRVLGLYAGKKSTGYQLTVREFQEPRILDFVNLSFGTVSQPLTYFDRPYLYDRPITDMVLSFNPEKIDEIKKLYGKQYLELTITYYNNRGEFIESKSMNNIVVCPGDNSPRKGYYDIRDCNKNDINVNNIMTRKTVDLNDWSRIELLMTHRASAYAQAGYTKKVTIILQRHYGFDVDVSIPGGLLVRRANGDGGFGGFSGISLAILPQFSFYHPEKIEKLRPYKIGAGFLALNAFNFGDNVSNRDVGIVVLGSVFPTTKGTKFSFPLYGGFGYFLRENTWFWVIGPGINLRL